MSLKRNFEIVFGSSAQLSVAWLRSYEGLGDAQMTLNGRTVRLPGLYGPDEAGGRFSQTFLLTFSAYHSVFQPELGLSGLLGFNVLPNSRHTLTLPPRRNLPKKTFQNLRLSAYLRARTREWSASDQTRGCCCCCAGTADYL